MLKDHVERLKERRAQIARERVALDEEDAGLARMIDAAEKGTVQVAPVPAPQVVPAPYPVPTPGVWPWPQLDPLTPWIVGPKIDHGGLCACPQCVSPVYCGPRDSTISDDGLMIWRECGTSDLTGGPYLVGTPLLLAPTNGVRLDSGTTVRIGDPLGLPVGTGIRYTAHGGIS